MDKTLSILDQELSLVTTNVSILLTIFESKQPELSDVWGKRIIKDMSLESITSACRSILDYPTDSISDMQLDDLSDNVRFSGELTFDSCETWRFAIDFVEVM